MILKIAGLLYILYIITVYLVIIIYETKGFIRRLKDKKMRKNAIKDLLWLILSIPIMPFTILLYFLREEYNLYL